MSQVLLRIKESEIQYLKQEIHSLKDELQSALRVRTTAVWYREAIHGRYVLYVFIHSTQQDKKYATDKYKGIYTELSIVKAKADCDIGKLKEKLLVATEALGERAVDGAVPSGYGKRECSIATVDPKGERGLSGVMDDWNTHCL